jgi:hypothetical protein
VPGSRKVRFHVSEIIKMAIIYQGWLFSVIRINMFWGCSFNRERDFYESLAMHVIEDGAYAVARSNR